MLRHQQPSLEPGCALDLEAQPANYFEPIRVLELHRSKASSLERSQRPAENLTG